MKYLIGVLLSFVTLTVSAEQYLCVGEQASGFKYDKMKRKWESGPFRTDNKYIITSNIAEYTNSKYLIKKVGIELPIAFCEYGIEANGAFFCNTLFGQFKFNKKSGRFMLSYFIGYVDDAVIEIKDKDSDTPYMEIGKCTSF